MLGNQVNEESFNLLHLELHCFRREINQFSKCCQFELCIFLCFWDYEEWKPQSKIRQVLFLFHLLIAFDDTSITTKYNIPELQIMFDEILTVVVGHNSGQNWKDYHFPAELNLPWAQVNCRTEETTHSSEYVAEISLSANHVSPRILSLQERETICSSLYYKSEQLQTCLPFLVHRTTGACTYIITFLFVSCISKQKLDLGKQIHKSKPAN